MGSAVVKPLTRHRGKMKANEIAVNFSDRKAEANVNSNCEASAGWQRKSLAGAVRRRLPDSHSGGSSETCSSNTHIIHKVCCTNIYTSRRPTPSESMEELYLTQFPRAEYSSSKTLINRDMGQLTLEASGNTGCAPSPAKMSVSSFTLYPETHRQDTPSDELESSLRSDRTTAAPTDSIPSPVRPPTSAYTRDSKGMQAFDCSCIPGTCESEAPYESTKLLQSRHHQPEGGANRAENELCQIFCCPSEIDSPRQWSRFLRTDLSTGDTADSLEKAPEGKVSDDTNSPAAPGAQRGGLSPDRIENIRQQLYKEGLNPAEREGGVAFFIPVTEDGMQPQTDGAIVAERLTKPKKASLNYEERMILANINRQAQLSKRKEFAVRDIRNVKGAAPTSDMNDRTKMDDDLDAEFDAFVSRKWSADAEFDVSLTEEEGS